MDAGPADFDAGPGVLDAGPPAGGRDDFLFSPGFAMEGDGVETAVAVAAEKNPEFNLKQSWYHSLHHVILAILVNAIIIIK